jgi:hypothetical protein
VIVDESVDGGESLRPSHSPKAEHRSFASSQRQMRVLNAIVEPVSC